MTETDLAEMFAGLLKEALRARGISQAEFARRIDRSEKHVSQVLTGKAGTTLNEWADWAAAIGLRWQVRMEPKDEMVTLPSGVTVTREEAEQWAKEH